MNTTTRQTPEAKSLTTGRTPAGAPRDALSELRAFFASLLEQQTRLIGACGGLVYLVETPSRKPGPAALHFAPGEAEMLRPQLAPGSPTLARLERIANEAAEAWRSSSGRSPGVSEELALAGGGMYNAGPTHRAIAAPLVAEGQVEGASVLLTPIAGDAEEALTRLALTCAKFETFIWRQRAIAEIEHKTRLRETLELLDAAQQGASAEAMGALMCHELARRFNCTRVSIGMIRGERIRLAGISGSDTIDRRGAAVETIEAAMEECASQDREVVYPPPPEHEEDPAQRRLCRAHETLSQKFGPSAMVSLPLRVEGDLAGVILLERSADDPFPASVTPLLRLIAEFVGPSLWARRLADRGLLAVTRDQMRQLGVAIAGPRHTGKKIIGLILLIALVVSAIPWMPERVTADASIKAELSRTIVAPFEGELDEVLVRPGDEVAEGDVLATMAKQEIEANRDRLIAEIRKLRTDRSDAELAGEQARVEAFSLEIEARQKNLDLVQYHLENADIRSPITGVVGQGDLEELRGSPVGPKDALFVIVGDDNIAALKVDETDIGRVAVGQEGELVLSGSPGSPIPIRVTHVNPVAEAVESANIYIVEVEILRRPDAIALGPGMSGTAKLRVRNEDGSNARVSPLGVMLDPVIDRIRMWLWI
jgi:multidrug efflux pump subunit AcrA (membrane-fusion protein)